MAKAYGYMAKIGVDTTGLTQANSDIRSFNSELKQIAATTKTSGESLQLLTQKNTVLGEEIKAVTEKLNALKAANEQIQQAAQKGDISAEQYRAYQREVANTETQLKQLQTQQAETQRAIEDYGTATQKATTQTKDYKTALNDLKTSANTVKNDLQGIITVAGTAAAALGAASVGAISEVVSTGQSFEAAMSGVAAISGASADDLERLKAAAEEMGASTSKTATESANALQYMALAGWDTEEMLEGLEPILRASEAGSMDLATCSDLVTDSMSAMGVTTDELTDYLNVLTAAQSNSNTSLQGILEAYIECGGTMRNLGVSIEESATLLGTLANRGIKASEAGHSLNSIMVNLTGGSSKASSALDELGISAWDSEGNFKGITQTLLELNAALETCTQEQATLFESAIGGKTQLTTLQAMISGVTEEYGELYTALDNADGALLSTAETMQDNLTGDITAMTSALEGLENAAYDYVQEPFREAAQAATEALRELKDSVESGELSGSMERLSENVSELLDELLKFAAEDGIPAVIEILQEVIEVLRWIIDNKETVVKALEAMAAGFAAVKITKFTSDLTTLIKNLGEFATTAKAAGGAMGTIGTAAEAAIPGVTALTAAIVAATAAANALDKAGAAKLAGYDSVNEVEETTTAIREQSQALKELEEANNIVEGLSEAQSALESIHDQFLATNTDYWKLQYNYNNGFISMSQDEFDELSASYEIQLQELEAYERRAQSIISKYSGTTQAARAQEQAAIAQQMKENANKTTEDVLKELGYSAENISAAAENVAEETAEATETTLESIVKSAWERISNEYTRNGNEYTEEMLAEMEAVLETIGDKESDLYDTYYTKYVSAQAAYQKQIDDLRDDEISDWEDYAEDLVDEIEKSADEVQSAIEKSKSDYLKSGTELGETVTDTEGNERFILNDMNTESKALAKYRADMDKLKATGVSEAVISSVYDFDYDSGDRQKYIDELLGMSDEDRERYDKEYQNYLAEVQKTAEYDNQGSINALEAASDTALESLDKATEYYEVGYSMAQEYYKGMADALNEVGIYDTAGIMSRSDVYTQGEAGTAGSAAGNYISTDTVISISVAGSEIIRGTIDDYLRGNLISGGNNTYV